MLNFDEFQVKEIKKGEELGLDVSVYAKPEYDADKMWCIRNLMQRGVDYTPLLHKTGNELMTLYKELKRAAK